jgi:hypothetical protein
MRIKIILGVLLAVFILLQIIPLDRSNPEITEWAPTTDEVEPILVKACYDCHSNASVWPWYAYVAPVSFLIARDVHKGREYLNLSEWDSYDEFTIRDLAYEIEEQVVSGEMPFAPYMIMHPDAKLSDAERQTVIDWARQLPSLGKVDTSTISM